MIKKVVLLLNVLLFIFIVGCTQSDVKQNDNRETKRVEQVMTLPSESLQKGDQGDSVNHLQHFLIEIGYPIEQTNIYDELTTWAITDLQLQSPNIHVTGVYDEETKLFIKSLLKDEVEISAGSKLEKPLYANKDVEIVENPYDILALVNKEHALPSNYEPHDLVVPDVRFPFTEDDPKKLLRQVAAEALEEMFDAADKDGIELYAQSGFRSFARQEAIFAANVERHGEEKANTYSARPGESEHQTGLVMDVTSRAIGFTLEVEFENTNEGKWIKEHAHKYGFIIRYPEGKESVTKYQYEPWHLRYVGKKAATEIKNNNFTLEEYLSELKNKN